MLSHRTLCSVVVTAALLLAPQIVGAFPAAQGQDMAQAAALAWAEDARLIYVENDEVLDGEGGAARWGYLYHSASRAESRAYSIEDGEIRVASNLSFDFDAPPLDQGWVDSGQALRVAEEGGGAVYRSEFTGRVRTMFLVRGILNPSRPEIPTWAIVYESANASGLWVLVDARIGKVVKTWRG